VLYTLNMRIEIINGIEVKVYRELYKELPMFVCSICSEESFFEGTGTCRDCLRVCRCCQAHVPPEDEMFRVIPFNKKILERPLQRHICHYCYTDWLHQKPFQKLHAKRDGWLKFRYS